MPARAGSPRLEAAGGCHRRWLGAVGKIPLPRRGGGVVDQGGLRKEEVSKVFRDYIKSGSVGYDQLGLEGFHALRNVAKGVKLIDVGEEIADERAVKLDEEVAIMREASKVTEASIRAALKIARPGLR